MPKVSVLTPLYKTRPEYLREAIESILAQSFGDFEFLILDDCPSDDRRQIVSNYRDARIHYSKNDSNLGISASRNLLIEKARGQYLAVFDHDDISLPDRLAKEVAWLDEHPDTGVVSSQAIFLPEGTITKHPESNVDIKLGLMGACCIMHTGAMMRKALLLKTGIRYEPQFSPAEDYMLFLRLIKHTMFYNLHEPLVKYRFVEDNTTFLQKEKMANADLFCRNYAMKEYPFLFHEYLQSRRESSLHKQIRKHLPKSVKKCIRLFWGC